jgi:selenocysteine-specific elongation factor
VTARVRPLGGKDRDGGVARLRLRRPLPLRIGDRAVLRDPGRRQVAAGVTVLDPSPPALRRRGAAARRADELAAFDGVPDAATELARRGQVRQAELVAWGVGAGDVERLDAVTAGGWLVDPARAPALVADLRAAVAAHDAADPLDTGLPLEAARRALGLPTARLVEALLRRVEGPGLVLRDGRVAADQVAALPERVRTALDALRADLERAPFGAPDAARLAELGLGPRELATLVRAGHLLRVADGVMLLPGADDRAVDLLRGLGPDFTLSSARQALGTSRRVAVPLLELLAGAGRTARTPSGGHRVV